MMMPSAVIYSVHPPINFGKASTWGLRSHAHSNTYGVFVLIPYQSAHSFLHRGRYRISTAQSWGGGVRVSPQNKILQFRLLPLRVRVLHYR